MDRRELLKYISLITGATVVGGDFFLASCKRVATSNASIGMFNQEDVAFFDEVAETIIPRTSTPGAKDAKTGDFIAKFVTDCYEPNEQDILKRGISAINEASQSQYNKPFVNITSQQRFDILNKIAAASKDYYKQNNDDAPAHYFTLFQQLALLGFFTAEQGFTQVLRFEPVPGKYEGCIAYNGETSWANN